MGSKFEITIQSMSLFRLRGKLDSSTKMLLGLAGLVLFIAFWWVLAELASVQKPVGYVPSEMPSSINADAATLITIDSLEQVDSIRFANSTSFEKIYPSIPPPHHVIKSFPSLYHDDKLLPNTFRSIWLNLQGYFWAMMIALPIGFLIGLLPIFRGLFAGQVDAMRYLPLTALVGLFTTWFGIDDGMKIAFLAFGIIVYILPVVVQRIGEVKDVYLKTVFTLGATDWQTVKSVYIPSVMSRMIDDIRVITAISWTYIIIAELLNRQGGIGSLIYIKSRQGQMAKVFAILLVIILIGFIQDRLFVFLDKKLLPHKYYKQSISGIAESKMGIYTILFLVALGSVIIALIPSLTSTIHLAMLVAVLAGIIMIVFGEFKLFQSNKQHA